ncbi:glycosyl transferase, group 1 [Methanococcus maripaludis C5]|uniref:Glycosyl transferase, group 1 n=1 Tax=Methanococcus maripaludis (strain C5 / ATCC BAA-1333) TaxID=402880 RepID=A4FX94_METM5|nr:glycosyltransferase family 4 protein [Methanococcus maripaludis]ABO34823.1 glycosyl transferase, group 1 [Methanococcus maripaludis C5]
MKKAKLLIFPGYFVPHLGGLETHTDEFSKYMPSENYDISIFAPNIPKSKEFEIRHGFVKVYRYPAFELISNYPVPNIFNLRFWKILSDAYLLKPDIVMTRTRFFSNTLLGLIYAKFRSKPKKLIHVEHGSDFVKLENPIKNHLAYFYDISVGKIIFKRSDSVIAISKAVHKFIKTNFLEKKDIPIIYRGMEIEEIEKIEKNLELAKKFENKFKICFLGRLYKWKGVENIIGAYSKLPEQIQKNTVLLIIGYGEDLERLKNLAGDYLDNGIYFLGKLDFKDAISAMKASDIYIHSSYPGGGLSSSLLQAMCSGKAIIASPHEGADEVIFEDNTGILLPNNNEEEIKNGICKLYSNKQLINKYGTAAKLFLKENFTWDSSIKQYIKILDRL